VISILDYGAGNLRSVENTLAAIGAGYAIVRDAAGVRAAKKLILPGVGHFGQMMRALDSMGVRETLADVVRGGTPFLGICLGLHALFESSAEAPEARGLGIFEGAVERFPAGARVPHMGWNELAIEAGSRLLAGTGERPYVYFAHSYYVPVTPHTAARCTYSTAYTAALEAGPTFGVQFHPEKSGPVGLKIVRNFVEL
jgi:imidazole glycerol phosphate synthase glutamine amidotransferase subunit